VIVTHSSPSNAAIPAAVRAKSARRSPMLPTTISTALSCDDASGHGSDYCECALPELPDARQERFAGEYGLSRADAGLLAADQDVAGYFDAAVIAGREKGVPPRTIAHWLTGDLFRWLRSEDAEIGDLRVGAPALVELLALVEQGTITAGSGRAVLDEMLATGRPAAWIVAARGLAQISGQEALAGVVDRVIAAHPDLAAQYRDGKETLLRWFVGEVIKATRGKANPQVATELLQEKLKG